MRIILIVLIVFCLKVESGAQDHLKDGAWITLQKSNKLFDFISDDSLKVTFYNGENEDKVFPILIEGRNILLLENETVFDTLKILELTEKKLVVYHSFAERSFLLIKGEQFNVSQEKLEELNTKNYRVRIYNENGTTLDYFSLSRNHKLREMFGFKSDCILQTEIQFENNNVGFLIHMNIRIQHRVEDFEMIVTEFNETKISGYLKDNGLKVELSFVEDELVKEVLDLSEFQGIYMWYNDSTELFREVRKDISIIHIGHSRFQFNKDKSFVLNDKHHGIDVYGNWRLFEYNGITYLGLEGEYSKNGLGNEYKNYYEVAELTKDYLILGSPSCNGGHGEADGYKWYLKKIE